MLTIKQNKEKLYLVMTQDEQDENFANAIKKFGKSKIFISTLKNLEVKVSNNANVSEFSMEIQLGEDLSECVRKLMVAKTQVYKVLHWLEKDERVESASFIDKLFDKAVLMVITKGMFEDEPGTQCPTEEG